MPADETPEKDSEEALDLSKANHTERESTVSHCSASDDTPLPSKTADGPTEISDEVVSDKEVKPDTSSQNITPVHPDVNVPAKDSTLGEIALNRCETSLSEINVVQNSPASDSKVSLDFEDDREGLLEGPIPVEAGGDEAVEDAISRKETVLEQSEVLNERGKNMSGESDNPVSPKFSPRLLKAVINCVPQALPDHVVKHFKGDGVSDDRKRKLSKSCDAREPVELSDSNDQVDISDSTSGKIWNLRGTNIQENLSDSNKELNLDDCSKNEGNSKLSGCTRLVNRSDSSGEVRPTDSIKKVRLGDSSKSMEPNCPDVQMKSCDENKKKKLNNSSKLEKRSKYENQVAATSEVPSMAAENLIMDKSTELDKSDKFYDIKRILLQATRLSSGVNLQRFRQFSNIFLKNWRFSKQFSRNANARGKQIIHNTLEKIVKELYENRLIRVKGPEENVDVVKMLTEELKHDNSRIFSQTPPTLTVLITAELFNKYFTGGVKEPGPGVTAPKRGTSKSVNLGSLSNQWIKLKDELGMETNEEVASILIHCYKAWISVACSKCRRHMEVGMEEKSGRSISNSETSVCIVSCDCGKSTSGGFMIECDVCHKWQHGFCVNVDKDNIPESYSCSWCRKIRGKVVLQSAGEKGEDSDDSVVSIDNTELCSTDDSEPEVIELD